MRERAWIGTAGWYLWRLRNKVAPQWLWFVLGLDSRRVGYGRGPLTWWRRSRHGKLRRKVHIGLLEYNTNGAGFGEFMAFWINERSKVCTASLNSRVEEADVVWVFSQDPLPLESRSRLLKTLARARPDASVVNPPEVYDSGGGENAFDRLDAAGVSVPRTRFGDEDLGRTPVVYKAVGQHAASKTRTEYSGPRPGYRAFEFVDSRGEDGFYRRYRAFYLLGTVHKGALMLGGNWNMYSGNMERRDPSFEMTALELDQIHRIARTLGLQYFSVDYLRRGGDDSPVFVDVNVYPSPVLLESGETPGYYGRWHNFDSYERLERGETPGGAYWDVFDEALLRASSPSKTPVDTGPSTARGRSRSAPDTKREGRRDEAAL